MIALRLAALVAALVCITLNAHHGFMSAKSLEYAILFALLYAALDAAKAGVLVAASVAWRAGLFGIAILCFLLFWPLFANSVWNATSAVAITRDEGKADKTATAQTRARTDADYQRRTAQLATLHANPLYAASAACALPKSKDARTFCAAVAEATTALASASTQLAATPPIDPQPQVTWLAQLLGIGHTPVLFTATLVPVLLAEIIGSVGFYIAARLAATSPPKPVERVSWLSALRRRRTQQSPPTPTPEPPKPPLAPQPAASQSTPNAAGWDWQPRNA